MKSSIAGRVGLLGRRRARRGISLLEVLVAIGVLSIGLLGVAAVIPVARHEMVEAAKADRSAACGQAALGDIKVRGTINPAHWRDVNGASLGEVEPDWGWSPYESTDRGYLFGESYAVDSLFVAENYKDRDANGDGIPEFADFPYNPVTPGTPVGARWTRMKRVMWDQVGRDGWVNAPLAQSLYKWHDDLLFPIPADESLRPQQFPIRDNVGDTVKGDFQGNYSWLVTVTPSPEHIDFRSLTSGDAFSFPESSPLYTVSVAVFYKRDMSKPDDYDPDPLLNRLMAGETPGERQVRLQFLGAGLGGGDVRLELLPGQGAEYLEIKENEWLLVTGSYSRQCYYQDPIAQPPGYSSYYSTQIGVHKWYRIVATGEIVVERDSNGNGAIDPDEDSNGNLILDPPYREATLAGPDWNVSGWGGTVYAGLFKGVVGVFSTTMELAR